MIKSLHNGYSTLYLVNKNRNFLKNNEIVLQMVVIEKFKDKMYLETILSRNILSKHAVKAAYMLVFPVIWTAVWRVNVRLASLRPCL